MQGNSGIGAVTHHGSHDGLAPSPWVARFSLGLPAGEVLDLACGSGRHTRLLATQGRAVLAVDRDETVHDLASLAGVAVLQLDLEGDRAGWPAALFGQHRYAGIVVTNYLHRPLFPLLFASLAPGGMLIYETFALGNERFGKPSNPDFLLRPGELLELAGSPAQRAQGMQVLAFEQGYVDHPKPAMVQRICVVGGEASLSLG